MDEDSFTLGDFISGAGSIYSTYTASQNSNNLADIEKAKTAAANAAAQQQSAMTQRTKTILIYSIIGVVVLAAVVFLFKKFK